MKAAHFSLQSVLAFSDKTKRTLLCMCQYHNWKAGYSGHACKTISMAVVVKYINGLSGLSLYI